LENAPHTLLYNVDVFSTIDVKDLYDYHVKHNALATLAVKQRETFRKFVFTNFDELCGWVNTKTGEEIVARSYAEDYAYQIPFCGISVVNSKIFPLITETGKFSIKDLYLRLAQDNTIIPYRCYNNVLWADLGTVEKINAISEILAHNRYLLNVEH
jgi:NDP-sugar pyrophosphorylase family protein